MVRAFKFLALALFAGLSSAIVTILYHVGFALPSPAASDIGYADFVTITLTALSLMITILGFFVAAAGVIGWTTLESKLKDHSVNYFKEQLSKNGPLRAEIEELIVEIGHSGIGSYIEQHAADGGKKKAGEQDYND